MYGKYMTTVLFVLCSVTEKIYLRSLSHLSVIVWSLCIAVCFYGIDISNVKNSIA